MKDFKGLGEKLLEVQAVPSSPARGQLHAGHGQPFLGQQRPELAGCQTGAVEVLQRRAGEENVPRVRIATCFQLFSTVFSCLTSSTLSLSGLQEKSGEARAASPSPSSPQLPHNLTEPAVESSGSHLVPPLANTDRGSRRKQKFSRAPTAENRYMSAKVGGNEWKSLCLRQVRGNAVEYFKRQQTAEEDDSTRTWLQLQIRALSRRCATIANSLWFNGLFALVAWQRHGLA